MTFTQLSMGIPDSGCVSIVFLGFSPGMLTCPGALRVRTADFDACSRGYSQVLTSDIPASRFPCPFPVLWESQDHVSGQDAFCREV